MTDLVTPLDFRLTSLEGKGAKPFIFIFLGPPGSGKGTHAAPLSRSLDIPHISTGDLFREHISKKTSLGNEAKIYIDQGKLVPDELVLGMLFLRIQQKDCKKGFILDGFPRTLSQGESLQGRCGKTHQMIAFNFRIADSYLIQRITGRIICKDCSLPYHQQNKPPKIPNICDACQGSLYQREDDKEEIIRKRLEVYKIQTEPLIAFYEKQQDVLKPIAADQSQNQVFEALLKAINASIYG